MMYYTVVMKNESHHFLSDSCKLKIIIDVDHIPDYSTIKEEIYKIWLDERTNYNKYIIYVYLPGMDIIGEPYAVGEFNRNKLKLFKIQQSALEGTSWGD